MLGTGPISYLKLNEDKSINFKHRLIIPINWGSKTVSFQSRDITNKSNLKYITCPKGIELMFHKNILYGNQSKWGEFGICVEGDTDVWRLGNLSFATFGIKYTFAQLRLIANTFKRVAVCFDPDPQAIEQAEKLVADLRFRGVDAFKVDLGCDPGDLPQNEADYLVKNIL